MIKQNSIIIRVKQTTLGEILLFGIIVACTQVSAHADALDDVILAKCMTDFPDKDAPLYSIEEIEDHCKHSKKTSADSSQFKVHLSKLKDAEVKSADDSKDLNTLGACRAMWMKVRDLRREMKVQNRELCRQSEKIKAKIPEDLRELRRTSLLLELGNLTRENAEKLKAQNSAIAKWMEKETLGNFEKNNSIVAHKYLDNLEKLKKANLEVRKKNTSSSSIISMAGAYSECQHPLHKEEVNKISHVDLKVENVKSACELAKLHGNQDPVFAKSRLLRSENADYHSIKTIKFESPLMQEQVTAITSSREFKEEIKVVSKKNEKSIEENQTKSLQFFSLADHNKNLSPGDENDRRTGPPGAPGPAGKNTAGSSMLGSLPLGPMLQAGVALAPLLMQKDEQKEQPQAPPKAASPKDTPLDTGSARVEASTNPVKKEEPSKGDGTSLKGYTSEPLNSKDGFVGSRSSVGPASPNVFNARVSKVDGGGSAGAPGSQGPSSIDKGDLAELKKDEAPPHGTTEGEGLDVGSGNSPSGEAGETHSASNSEDPSGGSSAVDDLLKTMENSLNPNKAGESGEIASNGSDLPNADSASDEISGSNEEIQAAKSGGDLELDTSLFLRIRSAHIRCLKTGCLIHRIPKKLNQKLEQEDDS